MSGVARFGFGAPPRPHIPENFGIFAKNFLRKLQTRIILEIFHKILQSRALIFRELVRQTKRSVKICKRTF